MNGERPPGSSPDTLGHETPDGRPPRAPARVARPVRAAPPDPLARDLQRAARGYHDNIWLDGLFLPLLIAVVATGFAAGPLAFLRAVAGWRLDYALPLLALLTFEGVYSTRQLGRPEWRDRRGLAFRLAEITLILVAVRLGEWVFATGLPGLAVLMSWLRRPAEFFDDQFVWTALIALVAWGFAVRMTIDFQDLALQADEVMAHEARLQNLSGSQERGLRPASRVDIMAGFVGRWIWAGIGMVFLAALTQVEAESGPGGLRLGVGQAGLPADTLAALLVYFVAGFILISEGRLAVLRGGWYNQDVPVAPSVLKRWQAIALLTLLVVGTVAALLPIGSTTGLAAGLEFLLAVLVQVFFLVVGLLIFLVSLALLPFRLLLDPEGAQAPPPSQIINQIPSRQEVASRLPDWLGGAMFWLLVAAIVGYLLYTYARTHGLLGGRLGLRIERVRFWWRARWARWLSRAGAAGAALRARMARLAPALPALPAVTGGRPRLIRPGALEPRARVRYFYLSTLRRAAQRGIDRPPHKTPAEFAADLRREMPEAEGDVEALTAAFLDARYDDRPIPAERARGVQPIWQRVMRAIARRRK